MPTIRGKRYAARHVPSHEAIMELIKKEKREYEQFKRERLRALPEEKKRDCCAMM